MRGIVAVGVTVLALSLTGCTTGASAELKDGWALMLAEDYTGARDHYEAMLLEYPDNPYALLNLGVAYQHLNEYDRARQNYEAAITHGASAEVTRVVEGGSVAQRTTTVADRARENLQTLPN